MFISEALPFIASFIEKLNHALQTIDLAAGLTRIQKGWLGFCLLGIIVTNSICWTRFERSSLGLRSDASLSWMFRQPNRFWKFLLRASVMIIIQKYGITEGVLVLDDSDEKRSKTTKRIYKSHKMKDKSSGGYINGQCIVLLLLVTEIVTIPVGFEFYMPDPELTAWNKKDKQLKKLGFSKIQRPEKPPRNENYPTKQEIALVLLKIFHQEHSVPAFAGIRLNVS